MGTQTVQIVCFLVVLQKKPLNLNEINPQSYILPQELLRKNPHHLLKSTRRPAFKVHGNLHGEP